MFLCRLFGNVRLALRNTLQKTWIFTGFFIFAIFETCTYMCVFVYVYVCVRVCVGMYVLIDLKQKTDLVSLFLEVLFGKKAHNKKSVWQWYKLLK